MKRSLAGVVLVAVVLIALGTSAAAEANAPKTTTVEITTPYGIDAAVSRFCGFTIAGESTLASRVTSFFDESDALTKKISHIRITGLLVKVGTGETLFTDAQFTEVIDVEAGTSSYSGMRFSAQPAAEPPRLQVVGRLVLGEGGVLDPDHQTPRFIAPILPAVCAAFST